MHTKNSHEMVKAQTLSQDASDSFHCPDTDKETAEDWSWEENSGILCGLRRPVEVALSIDVSFSLQKVKRIFEITAITSVCRPRGYSQAALPDIFGRASSGGELDSSRLSICSVRETATAGGLWLMNTLKPDS